jgi:hypothetical protein
MEYVRGRMDGRPTGAIGETVWAEEVTEEHYTTVTGD